MDSHNHSPASERRRHSSPVRLVFRVFLAVAGALLVLEHRAHLLGAWPLLTFLVACVAVHFLLHRSHGQGGHHGP